MAANGDIKHTDLFSPEHLSFLRHPLMAECPAAGGCHGRAGGHRSGAARHSRAPAGRAPPARRPAGRARGAPGLHRHATAASGPPAPPPAHHRHARGRRRQAPLLQGCVQTNKKFNLCSFFNNGGLDNFLLRSCKACRSSKQSAYLVFQTGRTCSLKV